jgi:hypothetical protein
VFEVFRRIVEISCHLGRKSSHLAAALASDRGRLCKLRTSILADFSKLRLFYRRVEGLNRDFKHTYNATLLDTMRFWRLPRPSGLSLVPKIMRRFCRRILAVRQAWEKPMRSSRSEADSTNDQRHTGSLGSLHSYPVHDRRQVFSTKPSPEGSQFIEAEVEHLKSQLLGYAGHLRRCLLRHQRSLVKKQHRLG